MKGKIFKPNEATAMIPLIQRVTTDLMAAYTSINKKMRIYEAARIVAEKDESRQPQLDRADTAVANALDHLQSLVDEIEGLGGTVKDYETGAIDFYGEVDGEIVYLSWQSGETEVTKFHDLEEDHGRRRVIGSSPPEHGPAALS